MRLSLTRLHQAALVLLVTFFASAHLLGCGAQVTGSVSRKPTSDGRNEVEACLKVVAREAPEHLSPSGVARAAQSGDAQVAKTPSGEPSL